MDHHGARPHAPWQHVGRHVVQIPEMSLGYLSLPGASSQDVLQAAVQSGWRRVGLRIGGRRPEDAGDWALGDGPTTRALARALADDGLQLSSVTAHYVAADTTAEQFEPVFEAAALLGAPLVCVSGYDTDFPRLTRTLAALCTRAAVHGLRIGLEFVPYSEVRSLPEAVRLLEATACPNAQVIVDMLHLARSGGSPALLACLPAERIAMLQLCDAAAQAPAPDQLMQEARTGRLLPGEGGLPLQEARAQLAPGVPWEVEIPCAALAGQPFVDQARRLLAATRAWQAAPTP